jgi:predicted tellurium resistance membrane protein TerC
MDLTQIIFSLITLTLLEVVLGIDNLVFLAILSSRLPPHQQKLGRRIGLTLAWVTRLILLGTAVWLAGLTKPLFTILGHGVSGRDLFLGAGGLFLLVKATMEIHNEFEAATEPNIKRAFASFFMIVSQIAVLDIIFSLDSVLTAIGLTREFWIMATAITIAILTMVFASEPLTAFVYKHPTVKMLALSFLLLIGMALVADAMHFHIPRGYIYFAVCFAVLVECLNILLARKKKWRAKS